MAIRGFTLLGVVVAAALLVLPAAAGEEAPNPDEYAVIDAGKVDFAGAAYYRKCASVTARVAQAGEEIVTIVDGTQETRNVANAGDYVVRNPGGEEYIVEKAKFEGRYALVAGTTDTYLPSGPPVMAVPLAENVRFLAPWGEEQFINAGGFLLNNAGDIYGIQKREFLETYANSTAQGEFLGEGGCGRP
ncbi:MAG: hypothetical protein HKM95_07705 [Inquilinus sp.]|nr:hypothetical protein [Inquilinus sp.]